MPLREPELDLLDRIAERGSATRGERQRLRELGAQLRRDSGRGQVGRYEVDLDSAHNLHIGDRVYYGADADAIIRAFNDAPRPRLRGVSGVLMTLGMAVAFGGFAFFAYTLFTIDPDPREGFPAEVGLAFGIIIAGIFIGGIGGAIAAWKGEPVPRRTGRNDPW